MKTEQIDRLWREMDEGNEDISPARPDIRKDIRHWETLCRLEREALATK